MNEEQKKPVETPKSTLGERMNDLTGIRILRDGKWVSITPSSKKAPEEPTEETK